MAPGTRTGPGPWIFRIAREGRPSPGLLTWFARACLDTRHGAFHDHVLPAAGSPARDVALGHVHRHRERPAAGLDARTRAEWRIRDGLRRRAPARRVGGG